MVQMKTHCVLSAANGPRRKNQRSHKQMTKAQSLKFLLSQSQSNL